MLGIRTLVQDVKDGLVEPMARGAAACLGLAAITVERATPIWAALVLTGEIV